MKRIIHSLWTLPMVSSWRDMDGKKQILVNLYLNTISAWYIKKWGGKIDLYSDSFGLWLLEHAPYDDRYLFFEDIDYDRMPCWATPKILTLDHAQVPFTHIDGDVLIKSQEMFDKITDDSFDLIVEEEVEKTEDNYFFNWHKWYFENFTDLSHEINMDKYCGAGTLTFNNEELKNEFVDKYFKYRDNIFADNHRTCAAWEFKTFVPDLIIEQCNLHQVSRRYKTKGIVNELAGKMNDFKIKYSNEYRHYAGKEKTHMCVEYFRNMLKQLDPELYNKTREKEEEVSKYLL